MKSNYATVLILLAGTVGFVCGQKAQKPERVKPELYRARLIAITQPDDTEPWKAQIKLTDGQLVPIDVGPGVTDRMERADAVQHGGFVQKK